MSRKLEHLLREWGAFHVKHMEHHLELGENILYRAGIMGGRVQDAGDGHVILCPDMPRHLQVVDIALKRLNDIQALVVKVFYCAPLRADGCKYTNPQLAMKTRMSLTAFEKNLEKGEKSLEKVLF